MHISKFRWLRWVTWFYAILTWIVIGIVYETWWEDGGLAMLIPKIFAGVLASGVIFVGVVWALEVTKLIDEEEKRGLNRSDAP